LAALASLEIGQSEFLEMLEPPAQWSTLVDGSGADSKSGVSRIRQHLETMSANKEAAIATAQVAAQESKPLRRRRRRARASAAV